MTTQANKEHAPLIDGAWYWVEKETWAGEQVIVAPACYDADSNAWYSRRFSGISTRFLKVLEPCVRVPEPAPAYRMLRAGVDIIEPDDEYLSDDTTTWERVGNCIFVGMTHNHALKPGRRRISTGDLTCS